MISEPYFPIFKLVSISSLYICIASVKGLSDLRTRFTAQNKLIAVGLEALISFAAISKSTPSLSASTIPNAAATPIAGAPLTVMFFIACITSW